MPEISIRKLDWHQWPEFASVWTGIHLASLTASFFLSREWLDCWLATFGEQLNPELLAFQVAGTVVGCCLLIWRKQWVRMVPLRRVYLNCAGEDEADTTYIEFNSILSLPGYQNQVAKALAKFLAERKWDEFLLPGMVEQEAVRTLTASLDGREVVETPARFVDLSRLRQKGGDYLSTLSSKTRYHIRHTEKAYEADCGPCTMHLARDADEALDMLHELAALHQKTWKARGQAGCFRSAKFTSFHERLIRQRFDRVLLSRVSAGAETIGLLYCFLYNGWVYHYQSGFHYTPDHRRSPGLLTLYHMIQYCLDREQFKGFDFMAGDVEYKRSLAAASEYRLLRWFVIRRDTLPSRAYLGLRALGRSLAPFLNQGRRSAPADSAPE